MESIALDAAGHRPRRPRCPAITKAIRRTTKATVASCFRPGRWLRRAAAPDTDAAVQQSGPLRGAPVAYRTRPWAGFAEAIAHRALDGLVAKAPGARIGSVYREVSFRVFAL